MIKYCKFLLLFLFFISSIFAFAQNQQANKKVSEEKMNIPFVSISYSYQFPLADMSKRFGSNSTIGLGFTYKTDNNVLLGVDWNFLFSSNVKSEDTLLKAISSSDDFIFSGNGKIAIVTLYERGHTVMFRGGKIFDVWAHNPNSGLFVTGGIGIITHRIKINVYQDDTPQLSKQYKKGYDRCSVGPIAGVQFGYLFFDDNRLINFKAEFEAYYGITRSIRPYNFDTMSKDHSWNNDVMLGLKVSWLLPLYPKVPKEYYYH